MNGVARHGEVLVMVKEAVALPIAHLGAFHHDENGDREIISRLGPMTRNVLIL